jgi:pseudaminic acid synthase
MSSKPIVVAEISGNHNGSLDTALELLSEIAKSGCTHVKLQTYTPDTITLPVNNDIFRISNGHELWGGETLYELYSRAHTPWDWHLPLYSRAAELGLTIFSTPFDSSAVEFLENLNTPLYKIASIEIVDLPLIRLVSETGKPVIISTGTANVSEIAQAVEAARGAGCEDLTLLVCTSSYPALPREANLSRMKVLREIFNVNVGLSDHTLGIGVSVAAAALGASIIERHVTLSRAHGGVDSAFSIEPTELSQLVRESLSAMEAIGNPYAWRTDGENESVRLRPSLFVTKDVKAGETVSPLNVRSVRPSGGLAPDDFSLVKNRTFKSDFSMGSPVNWNMFT